MADTKLTLTDVIKMALTIVATPGLPDKIVGLGRTIADTIASITGNVTMEELEKTIVDTDAQLAKTDEAIAANAEYEKSLKSN